jgi:hypothetical protein
MAFLHNARFISSLSDCRVPRTPSLSAETESLTVSKHPFQPFYALISYEDAYVQPLILSALASRLPQDSFTLVSSAFAVPSSSDRVLHIRSYEELPFEDSMAHPDTCLVNAYIIRKALVSLSLLGLALGPSLLYSRFENTTLQ